MTPATKSRLTRAFLRYLGSTTGPIVLGPYRSELGFEALYWLPFLQWALTYAGIPRERCIALSRGGMGHLYPAAHQIDLYGLRGIDPVRLENIADHETRKVLKQTSVTKWDRAVAREAVDRVHPSGTRFHLLHPSWMYWLLSDFWEERAGLPHIAAHCLYDTMPVPSLPANAAIPEKFIAVKFYERATLPMQPEIKILLRELVATIASQIPVVVLHQPYCVDDHVDLPLMGPNIVQLAPAQPDQHVLFQAAVLARCQAFVGTYGGVAQLALRFRRPSLSVFAQFGGTMMAHRTLSHVLSAQMKVPFEMLDLSAIKLWQLALGPLVEAPTGVERRPMSISQFAELMGVDVARLNDVEMNRLTRIVTLVLEPEEKDGESRTTGALDHRGRAGDSVRTEPTPEVGPVAG